MRLVVQRDPGSRGYPRPRGAQLQHRKLASKTAATEAKQYWAERFAALAEMLVAGKPHE